MKKIIFLLVAFWCISGFSQQAVRISPPGASYIDPEFSSLLRKGAFQTPGGNIWLADIDPFSGLFVSATGMDTLMGTGAMPLVQTFNGPEFGIDQHGWALFYSKQNQVWRSEIVNGAVQQQALSSGEGLRASTLATKSPDSQDIKLLYSHGPSFYEGHIIWASENTPSAETVVDTLDMGVRWIDGTQDFMYIKQTGPNAGQIAWYHTADSSEQILTNDADTKTYCHGWFSPEYQEVIAFAILNDTVLGIFRDLGGPYWEKITTINYPESSAFKSIGSPEPFVAGGKSFISFVTRASTTTSSYVPAEVWVTDIAPDASQRLTLRCDDGAADAKRTDPETLVGIHEVFVYYNLLNTSGDFEVWRFATGIPVTTNSDPILTKQAVRIGYSGDEIHILSETPVTKMALYDLQGHCLRQNEGQQMIALSTINYGLYILKIEIKNEIIYHKIQK